MEIEDLLTRITGILDKLKIPYIITGGMAVSIWGRTRYTADIDIVVELLEKNINLLAKELRQISESEWAELKYLQNRIVTNSRRIEKYLQLDGKGEK